MRTQSNLVKLHKRGRMLVASYKAIRFQRLNLFSITLRQIGGHIARMHLNDAIKVIMDGNDNPAEVFTVGTRSMPMIGPDRNYAAAISSEMSFV